MKKAQDQIISIFTAPIKKQIASIQAENDRNQAIQADIDAGCCVCKYGIECANAECLRHSDAYDIIDGKPPDVTAYAALISAGFSADDAREQIAIFFDLGVIDQPG